MNAWKVVCATLVIFIAGIVTGATLVRFAQRAPRPWRITQPGTIDNRPQLGPVNPDNRNTPNNPRPPNANAPTLLNREFVQGLERQLRLTPEQRERIDQIMAEGQERIRQVRAGIEPQVRKEMQKTHEQIITVLGEKQREQFERLMKQRVQRRNEASSQPERRNRDPRERNQPLPPPDAPRDAEPSPRQPAPPFEPQSPPPNQ